MGNEPEPTLEAYLGALRNAMELIGLRAYNGDLRGARDVEETVLADLRGAWGKALARRILEEGAR